MIGHLCGGGERETGLAHSSRAGQGQQAGLFAAFASLADQPPLDRLQLAHATQKSIWLRRQGSPWRLLSRAHGRRLWPRLSSRQQRLALRVGQRQCLHEQTQRIWAGCTSLAALKRPDSVGAESGAYGELLLGEQRRHAIALEQRPKRGWWEV